MSNDRWLERLRAIVGTGLLGWEAVAEHMRQPWVLILVFWLLGAKLEQLVQLLTSGRIQINVSRDDPPEKPGLPAGDDSSGESSGPEDDS